MRVRCSCCDQEGDDRNSLACSICKKKYLLACIDVSKTEATRIRADSGLSWSCVACRAFSGSIAELKQLILDLQTEIKSLKTGGRTGSGDVLASDDFERVVQEVVERERRKNNIIIFKVMETTGTTREDQVALDVAAVGSMLDCLGAAPDGGSFRVKRLGKYDPSKENLSRPIRVELPDESLVLAATRNSARLRELVNWAHVSISRDRTPKQVELYRSVKEKLDKRIRDGEDGLRIKYVNGVPTIVALN